MQHHDEILDTAETVAQELTEYKRYIKTRQELQALQGQRGRPNLALQLITMNTREDANEMLKSAENMANGEIERKYDTIARLVKC